ncbi:DedA family protein [Compostimonas suwonensis]|uniref:Membrane protein DedA with SNARE-associated domain n=1 Tax=Compostimonas suwonensis TaxID=1048394 RepID=A0A2M9BTW3_9MICO|nr:DedA family protein [Compostimonas suwonensis]PJJ61380.1 membrane protein DedA with SNARE-associated domain [Compostimonas suwonensis]
MDAIADALTTIADSPWVFPLLFALTIGDAFLVVLPSETAVVALGALSLSTGHPPLAGLLVTAALGAIAGDNLCYLIGRSIGTERFAWMRRPRVHAALERARTTLQQRAAVAIFTARYIPFARIAVNLTAGATRLHYARYLLLTVLAGCAWALYNTVVGALFGQVFAGNPVLAVVASVVVAIVGGVSLDWVLGRMSRRRQARKAAGSGGAGPHPGTAPGAAPAPE